MKYILILILLIPFNVKASMIAYEMNSNKVLYSDNIHEQRSVASISKIMTAIIAIESGKLDDIVVVGDEINKAYGSGIYIEEGEEIKLRDLVIGLMLRSGNDSSLAIAKYVGGSVDNFVSMMNYYASKIGMKNTTFNNPNGLEDAGGNISTCYDMAILTTYAMKNKEYRDIVSTKKYNLKTNKNTYSWINKNKLLFSYKYITGGKTGYTEVAHRTLVTTASKDNVDIVIVTLNDGNDWVNHKNLYTRLFDEYKGYYILKKGNINVLNYQNDDYYYVTDNFIYPLNNNEKDKVKLKFILDINGEYMGNIYIYLDDKKIGEEKVYRIKDKKISFLEKIWIKIKNSI